MNDYLTKEMLNEIEEMIEELQGFFLSKFQLNVTYLRTIRTGDSLNNKVLYLSFPWNSYENIVSTDFTEFITTENYKIRYRNTNGAKNTISFFYDGTNKYFYAKNNYDINNYINFLRYKLPKDYGRVIDTDEFDCFYPYIKIVDNPTKLLAYTPKIWQENEIPYLQNIDHIEEGIRNIAKIFYEPAGYETKEWTTTGNFETSGGDYGLAQKPIKKSDFIRWKKNIELLKTSFDEIINIYNVVSYIEWNEESQFEWEE